MSIKYTLSQTKTIEGLAVLSCALLGEDVTVSADQPDPNGRTVEAIFESESSNIRAMIDGGGAVQSLVISVDGKPCNPDVNLSNLFGLVQRKAKPKKAN